MNSFGRRRGKRRSQERAGMVVRRMKMCIYVYIEDERVDRGGVEAVGVALKMSLNVFASLFNDRTRC